MEKARAAVRICMEAFEICLVDRSTLEEAANMTGDDFEDNLQMACARIFNLDAILTRDQEGFKTSTIPTITAMQLLEQLT